MGETIKASEIYFNGHKIKVDNFELTDLSNTRFEDVNLDIENNYNAEIIGTIKINWVNRLKFKLWMWRESLRTHEYTFSIRSK